MSLFTYLQNNVFFEDGHMYIVEFTKSRQNFGHRFGLCLFRHGANTHQHLFAGIRRRTTVGIDAIVRIASAQVNVTLKQTKKT